MQDRDRDYDPDFGPDVPDGPYYVDPRIEAQERRRKEQSIYEEAMKERERRRYKPIPKFW